MDLRYGYLLFALVLILDVRRVEHAAQPSSGLDNNQNRTQIPNISSRLGESVLLKCGEREHELLRELESSGASASSSSSAPPVLVNWFKHYSATRRSDKPIYAKYLANNIDYAPHISRDYENRLSVTDKIDLTISGLKALDEAVYECRLILFDKAYADSQLGSMYYLHVHVPPEFEYPNEEVVYFKPNVPIRLYCYAKGKPQPSITWYKNGERLSANTSVLQETFISGDNGGDIHEYRCRAENPAGYIEHTVRVIRSGSLFFTEPLRNLTVMEGTILNWPCLAQSNAEITYKWFKDSVSVQSHLYRWADRGALFQDGMLYLLETYRNDSGLYECHAYTANNKRIDTSAYLNVLYGPEIVPFESPHYVFEGTQSIVIDCVIKSNPAVLALEWFKDKYLLSNTNKYQILPNNSLLIRHVKKSDRGNYYCVCNNTIKKAISPIVKLEIVDLKATEMAFTYNAYAHDSIRLACDSISEPIVGYKVKWIKINSVLGKNQHEIDANGSLMINHLKPTNTGYYFCLVNEDDIRKPFLNERLIRLNVIQNKTHINHLSAASSFESIDSNNNDIIELPLAPENLELNQTLNGVWLKWTKPKQSSARIEYYQIYFREINDKTSPYHVSYEWKTTEPIGAEQTAYFIDDVDLVENRPYEIHVVSFAQHSKSSPSQTIKFRYLPNLAKSLKKSNLNQMESAAAVTSSHSQLIFKNLLHMSQLDLVLMAIFVILMFVLAVCIIACIVYRRSAKKCRRSKANKKCASGDVGDEWGFQSASSAATATFLSGSSSSSSSVNSQQPQQQSSKIMRNSDELTLKKIVEFKDAGDGVGVSDDNDDDDTDDYNYLITSSSSSHQPHQHQQQQQQQQQHVQYQQRPNYHHHYMTYQYNNKNNSINQPYHHHQHIKASAAAHRKSLITETIDESMTTTATMSTTQTQSPTLTEGGCVLGHLPDRLILHPDEEEDVDYYYRKHNQHHHHHYRQQQSKQAAVTATAKYNNRKSSNSKCSSSNDSSPISSEQTTPPTTATTTSSTKKKHVQIATAITTASNTTTTTSGVASDSPSNSLIQSSDNDNMEDMNNNNTPPIVPTTIKYNAKTNKLRTSGENTNTNVAAKKQLVLLSSRPPPKFLATGQSAANKRAHCNKNTTADDDCLSSTNSYIDQSEINDVSIDVDCSNKPPKDSPLSSSSSSSSNTTPSKYVPFPTSHFLTFQIRNQGPQVQPILQTQSNKLNSSSSLTMVSKMPSTSYAYINEPNQNTSADLSSTVAADTNAIRIILSNGNTTSGTTTTNPGGSSSLSSTSSGCSSLDNTNKYYVSAKKTSPQTNHNYFNYSTYRPTPTKKATATNENNNRSTNLPSTQHHYHHRASTKIDYV